MAPNHCLSRWFAMLALFASIFLASLLGSFHCAGMCGAFVAIACGAAESSRSRQVSLQTAYHGGRLLTYVLLGVAAGTAGRLLDVAGSLAGLQSTAAILAAATMLLFAVAGILHACGVSLLMPRLPARWQLLIQRGHRAAMDTSPVPRAFAIGLLTTLLPCGWLYAFVVTAIGTGSIVMAAAVMAAFWLGTLPMLMSIGVGARSLLGRTGRWMPVATATLVAAISLYVLVQRANLNAVAIAATTEQQRVDDVPACCTTSPGR